jgi:hypothetical protein
MTKEAEEALEEVSEEEEGETEEAEAEEAEVEAEEHQEHPRCLFSLTDSPEFLWQEEDKIV